MTTFLANANSRMSVKERMKIHEEIHGVRCLAPNESPKMLEASLRKLDVELHKIPFTDKLAFIKSQQLFPHTTYANDRDFRLRFLRSELFDARKAAVRLVNYMQFIVEAFPRDVNFELLQRTIQVKDLEADEETRAILRSGWIRLLGYRDRSGRRIFLGFLSKHYRSLSARARLRVVLYLFLTASNDVESQRKGLVIIMLPSRSTRSPLPEARAIACSKLEMEFPAAIPIRIAAIHFCSRDIPSDSLGCSPILAEIGEKNACRLKLHSGGLCEMKEHLTGYGIPHNAIPSAPISRDKLTNHQQWIGARALIEETGNAKKFVTVDEIVALDNFVECPGLNDVIFQTAGKSWALHPGDVYYRGLIEFYHKQHSTSNQTEKSKVVMKIVASIKKRKGRFLTHDSRGWWIELKNRSEIRKKVALSLRNFNNLFKKRSFLHNGVLGRKQLAIRSPNAARPLRKIETSIRPLREIETGIS